MRILQLNVERGWRGGERQTLLSLRHFRDAGHDAVLLARKGGALAKAAEEEGFIVAEADGMGQVCSFLLRHGRSFDVIHAQSANMMTWLALLKPMLGRRIVFTRRTAFPVNRRQALTAWKWRQADVLAAISQAAAAEPRRLGLQPVVIPSAVERVEPDATHIRTLAAELPIAGKRVLATAAALTREKDPLTLIRAVAALRRHREDFVFLHFGAGGESEQEARSLVAALELGRHYLFAGFRSPMEDLYALMDVFVLSSRAEALGTSVLDAFLYGVPVVATDAGGLAELLADDRGFPCRVGDHEGMARAMMQALDDPDRGRRIERARRYVMEHHDPAIMGARYLEQYRALVDRRD